MIFADRTEAGRQLAGELRRYADSDAAVLGIPRGGVVVAREIADALGAPLDVVIPRKIRSPGNPELGLGAVAPGVEVLDERLIRTLGVTRDYLDREIAEEKEEIERRSHAYREGRPPLELKDKVAIVADDGIATGGTAIAAVRWAKAQGAKRVILAVPVAPPSIRSRMQKEADEYVVLFEPETFYAVGQWYRSFEQVGDEIVVRTMSEAAQDTR